MRSTPARLFGVAVFLLCSAMISFGQGEARYKGLPNFHKVNSQLFRGAQPKSDGWKELVELGIKTVVNLRDDDERALAEEQEAKRAGLRYFNLPFPRIGGPRDEQMQKVLEIINSSENQPIFVHCRRGSDRTGTVIAIYRIERDGWTREEAQAEANRHGMAFWHWRMRDYIRSYNERFMSNNSH